MYRIYLFCSPGPYFFNQTHYRALIQAGPYSSMSTYYFQSKIMQKITAEDKYFMTLILFPCQFIHVKCKKFPHISLYY